MKRYLLSVFFIALFYLPCYISNYQLVLLTKEDGLYENTGAILFLLTAIAFFVLAVKPRLYLYGVSDKYPQRKYFLFFGVLFILAFVEEISWGQRILNFETPEYLKEINMQEEFNLHNIDIFHGKSATGEEKTGIRALLTLHKMFYMAFLSYLFIVPILYHKNARIKSFLNRISLPIPGIFLGVLFIFNWIFANMLGKVISDLDGHGIVEIKETVIALILFALPLSFLNFERIRGNRL